ncbi:uncharacterized protein EV422DRAFT_562968 [Fimicolochytrium jonesii]|uniref:uncharacterized protein n=1 Tax=Fimicolochytrium jonesii TaxID=1396493 RepID=UPI0022FEA982|nr:uncharacterized protein EV422DRAFT_562968 [Fimicolochytrium jonesii]KAI8826902.1 hypothetical protein EV422DRAFT_562968 [Fimicolochytrium jonesii]
MQTKAPAQPTPPALNAPAPPTPLISSHTPIKAPAPPHTTRTQPVSHADQGTRTRPVPLQRAQPCPVRLPSLPSLHLLKVWVTGDRGLTIRSQVDDGYRVKFCPVRRIELNDQERFLTFHFSEGTETLNVETPSINPSQPIKAPICPWQQTCMDLVAAGSLRVKVLEECIVNKQLNGFINLTRRHNENQPPGINISHAQILTLED